MTIAREHTLDRVDHPDYLRWQYDNDSRQRIDDPVADAIAKGDPTFGWEGDPRYCLYVNYTVRQWELWRREGDGQYRPSVAVPGHLKGVDAVAWLVKWIVEHDTHRGFNPAEFVIAESIHTQKARDDAAHARNEEAADALHFGLMRDTGHLNGGLTRRLHSVPGDISPPPPPTAPPVPERTAAP